MSVVLLATNKQDITTDFVVRELQARSVPYLRLNTEDLPQWQVTVSSLVPFDITLRRGHRRHELRSFTAGYLRRPLLPDLPEFDEAGAREYAGAEWGAIARTIWNAMHDRWLNSPFTILRAEDKPRQLALARRVGLTLPATLITNDFDEALHFQTDRTCIAKPIRHALIEQDDGDGRLIYTSDIDRLCEADRAAFSHVPIILQEKIEKLEDIRVTIVGKAVFAVAIESQTHVETRTDWRRGSRTDLKHTPFELPSDIAARCLELMKVLGLRFAAIDFVRDRAGELVFLEANPNGQWAWVEQVTGIPICAAIVDVLTERT